ncbi:hypothetical protein [Burkholderia pyrrocinia]|nr:hypothetical protein [Burkholderia pyrrocinia]
MLALQQAVARIAYALRRDSALPEHVNDEPAAPTGKIKNPFTD